MHTFEVKVDKFITQNGMLSSGDRVVLGVSGGADSTALFFVMLALRAKYNLELSVVHINHGIREEAAAEARIVRELCDTSGIEFILREYDVQALAREYKKSTEEMGRELRYKAFREVLGEASGKIAVAHNMNDQAETMLFNLFRGTGITGLSSISPIRDNVIRPLLCATRDEIEQYLSDKGVSFCTDKSNFTDDYTRNRIRNNIIPVIKSDVCETAVEHMANTAGQLRELGSFVNACGKKAYAECLIRENDDEIVLSKERFDAADIYIRKLLVKLMIDKLVPHNRDITSAHIESLVSLPKGQGYKEVKLPYNLRGFVSYNETGIKKASQDISSVIEIPLVAGEKAIISEERYFISEFIDFSLFSNAENRCTKYLSCDKISNQMVIRTRREGDYIIVNGNGGRKKLKDYFIDLKIPAAKRDEILLLADGNRIMWVVGYRIGEDCKVTDKTAKILKIMFVDNKKGEDI